MRPRNLTLEQRKARVRWWRIRRHNMRVIKQGVI